MSVMSLCVGACRSGRLISSLLHFERREHERHERSERDEGEEGIEVYVRDEKEKNEVGEG